MKPHPTHRIKRCQKCGHKSLAKPKERRCKIVAAGRYCWGALAAVMAAKPKGRTLEDKRAHAHAQLAVAIRRVKRATTSIGLWQRRIAYFEKAIDQRDHPDRKPARPKPVRKTRAITLDDV